MEDFYEGYDNFAKVMSAETSSEIGKDYIGRIKDAIDQMANNINAPSRSVEYASIDSLKGFVAEWWHEGTYNIDSALKGNKSSAYAPDDNKLTDILFGSDQKASLKYYKDAASSAKQQAKTWGERYAEYCAQHKDKATLMPYEEYIDKNFSTPYYEGHVRVIPSDQLKEAQKWLMKKIAKETASGRYDQVKRYQETLDYLTDSIKGKDGSSSIPLTEARAKEIARLAKNSEFDPAQFGLTFEECLKPEYILNQAFKAGLSASLVSMALNVAPKICGLITKLISSGDINLEEFKTVGFAAVKGGAESFITGTVSAAITIEVTSHIADLAIKGVVEETAAELMQSVCPSIIGAMTVVTLNTIKNAFLLSVSKIDKAEFVDKCAQDLVKTLCSFGLGIAGAAAFSALFTPATAVFGFMIGSFIGSALGGFIYKGLKKCVLAFCVKSGCTFFGLVEQDYVLPDEVIKSIGLKVFEYEYTEPKEFEYDCISLKSFYYDYIEPEKINVQVLRRGVIELNHIGYIN